MNRGKAMAVLAAVCAVSAGMSMSLRSCKASVIAWSSKKIQKEARKVRLELSGPAVDSKACRGGKPSAGIESRAR